MSSTSPRSGVRISENPRLAYKALALIMMVSPTALKANTRAVTSARSGSSETASAPGPYRLAEVKPERAPGSSTRFDDVLARMEPGPGRARRVHRAARSGRRAPDDRAGRRGHDGDLQATTRSRRSRRIPRSTSTPGSSRAAVHDDEHEGEAARTTSRAARHPAPVEPRGVERRRSAAWSASSTRRRRSSCWARTTGPSSTSTTSPRPRRSSPKPAHPNGGFKITHYYLEGDTHQEVRWASCSRTSSARSASRWTSAA